MDPLLKQALLKYFRERYSVESLPEIELLPDESGDGILLYYELVELFEAYAVAEDDQFEGLFDSSSPEVQRAFMEILERVI